jgi:hypothetical protein
MVMMSVTALTGHPPGGAVHSTCVETNGSVFPASVVRERSV